MAFGILQAVLLVVGIEMRAGGFEVGAIALGILMEVDGVFARRKTVEVKLEVGASGSCSQRMTVPTDLPWASLSST